MQSGGYCDYFVVVDYNCIPGEDPQGSVCANEGKEKEAYCFYEFGSEDGKGACGYCREPDSDSPDTDTEGTVPLLGIDK